MSILSKASIIVKLHPGKLTAKSPKVMEVDGSNDFHFSNWVIDGLTYRCEHLVSGFRYHIYIYIDTLPESNIAPENRPLEKEIPIGKHHFQVLC